MSQPPPSNETWRRRAAAWAAPLLLVAIAVLQIVRVHRHRQSTWAGVGFGMFATIDGHASRFVRGFVTDAAGERYVQLPRALADEACAARVVPTDERARRIAERWLSLSPPCVTSVRVEVWGYGFDRTTRSLSIHRLAAPAAAAREPPP